MLNLCITWSLDMFSPEKFYPTGKAYRCVLSSTYENFTSVTFVKPKVVLPSIITTISCIAFLMVQNQRQLLDWHLNCFIRVQRFAFRSSIFDQFALLVPLSQNYVLAIKFLVLRPLATNLIFHGLVSTTVVMLKLENNLNISSLKVSKHDFFNSCTV